ncbi:MULTISPECIES: hypothetical protein [Acetobacter]|uniref:hypothetical protein n=1 Tax=Acetobacter TaxID=434 RepID=UPI00376FDA3D
MLVNWCFKGITESPTFDDTTAEGVLTDTGLLSQWIIHNRGNPLAGTQVAQQNALSASALDDHVNAYRKVSATTPYISLGAGCVEYNGRKKPALTFPAIGTALKFATKGGKSPGFVFRLWVVTTPKPAPDIPGLAEDVRDLKLFPTFHRFHYQGEVTAKLYVPRRQIAWVMKFDAKGNAINAAWKGSNNYFINTDFVEPDAISNVIGAR